MNTNEASEETTGDNWQKPVEGEVTSYFSERLNPITGKHELHNGLDIAVDSGTPAAAIAEGVVLEAGENSMNGKYVVYRITGGSAGLGGEGGDSPEAVEPDSGYTALYAHLSEILVAEGETVSSGQTIAKTGSTGRSTGPHLHLTLRKDGQDVDPAAFFDY